MPRPVFARKSITSASNWVALSTAGRAYVELIALDAGILIRADGVGDGVELPADQKIILPGADVSDLEISTESVGAVELFMAAMPY